MVYALADLFFYTRGNLWNIITSGDVHKAIKKIFTLPCKRRVAVVAYLGVNAENYLPNPRIWR